jgi:hypothetical protein
MMMEGHNNLTKRALESTFVARTYSARDLFVCNDCSNQYIKIFPHLRVHAVRYKFFIFNFGTICFPSFFTTCAPFNLSQARFVQLPLHQSPFLAEKPLENLITRAMLQSERRFSGCCRKSFLFHFLTGASSGPCDLDEILGRAPFGSDFMLDFAFIFIRNKSIVRALTLWQKGQHTHRNIPVVHGER